ncbi:hypothetical protein AAH991_39275 [Microbispora sp. ZYX-F-249]|uniref:DUF4328 domain-containing protein n=1 Tax=Microbispora maris TaxID=3144104 RepID=A0ABV0B133_9ACTN
MRAVAVFRSAAVVLSLWELLVEPMFAEVVTVVCSGGLPLDMASPGPAAGAAEFLGDWLALLQPALLALAAAWALRSRPGTALRPARSPAWPGAAWLGLTVALLPTALAEAGKRLAPEPPQWWRECLEDQSTPPSLVAPRLVLAWLLSPATMVLLAGLAGRRRHRPAAPLLPVAGGPPPAGPGSPRRAR